MTYQRYPGLRRPKVHVSAEEQRARLLAELDEEAAVSAHERSLEPRHGEPEQKDGDAR